MQVKLPSDAEHRFFPLPEAALCFISVGTEMKRKLYECVFGVFLPHKAFLCIRDLLFFNPAGVKKSNTKETPFPWGVAPIPTKKLFEKSFFELQKLL
ncbi:MAG: hypothetical protein IIU77_06470 [Clostridia bacterium]|nr:hypothetical protein [Clostridia bacterium]MBQ5602447.1 hypothetical protein [Clostridia bacterium]